jgi:hypothetical protein
MTRLLEQAFEEAARLPAEEQNSLAQWLLAELHSEARWSELFESAVPELERLAKEALAEHGRGETKDLDPETL